MELVRGKPLSQNLGLLTVSSVLPRHQSTRIPTSYFHWAGSPGLSNRRELRIIWLQNPGDLTNQLRKDCSTSDRQAIFETLCFTQRSIWWGTEAERHFGLTCLDELGCRWCLHLRKSSHLLLFTPKQAWASNLRMTVMWMRIPLRLSLHTCPAGGAAHTRPRDL